nr:hypothetical protein [Tanacetum cinerariifolium]
MKTVPDKDYILLPLWTQDPLFSSSFKDSLGDGFKPSGKEEKKDAEDPGNKDSEVLSTKEIRVYQEKYVNVSSTNNVNIVSLTANAAGIEDNVVDENIVYGCVDDLNMPDLEEISRFSDAEDDDTEADMNNLDTYFQVSHLPTTRVHKDHPLNQVIGDVQSAIQTRNMLKNLEEYEFVTIVYQRTNHKYLQNCLFTYFLSQEEPKKVVQALKDPRWIEAMREKLLQFKLQEVWTLVELPNRKGAIGTKWVFRNKKDEKGIVIKNKARLVTQGLKRKFICQPPGFEDPNFLKKVYKVENALYGLHQAPKAWYETLSTYLLDNRSTRKELCTEFEKIMHKKFKMSSMGELTFFLGLQKASTHMETKKPLLKDEDGVEVDVHLYRSMIGTLMYLTSSRPYIMFVVCACARFQVNPIISHLHVVKRIFRYLKGQPKLSLWYLKDSSFDLVAYTDSDYAGARLDRKSTTGGCQFLGCRLILWQCKKQTVVANSITEVKYVAASNCCGQVLCIQNQLLDYGYNFMQTKIHINNESTICIVKIPIFHSKTKHIGIRHHFIKDSNEKKHSDDQDLHRSKWKLLIFICSRSYTKDVWNKMEKLLKRKLDQVAKNINGEAQIHAKVDGKKVIISEAIIRRDLKFKDEGGVDCISNEVIFEQLILMCDSLLSGEDSIQLKELMKICIKLQQRVINLENTKIVQAQEISSLKKRVKRLEKQRRSRTHKLKRFYKVGLSARVEFSVEEKSLGEEDASKQGRNIANIDADVEITLVDETAKDRGRFDDQEMFDIGVLDDEEVVVEKVIIVKEVDAAQDHVSAATTTTAKDLTVDDITLAKALEALKTSKPKIREIVVRVHKEPSESTIIPTSIVDSTRPKEKGIVMEEPSEATTTILIPSKVQHKRKGIMVEEPLKMKKKYQISFDVTPPN